jgi:hypothetical protein
MNDAPLYNSRINKTFVEYLSTHYPGLDINPVLGHSGISISQFDDDLAASYLGHQNQWESTFVVRRFYGHK